MSIYMRLLKNHTVWPWLVVVFSSLPGCEPQQPTGLLDDSTVREPLPPNETTPWFQEISVASGVEFTHQAGRFEDYEMPSVMGSGGACIDFDRDGLLDLYLVNGGGPKAITELASESRIDGFFRQLPGNRFQNVFRESRIAAAGFGMGASWGDFDDDGFPDLFLTSYGANQLLHNQGDGTFREVPLLDDEPPLAWSTASVWADIDADGWLDLFVVNYVDYIPFQQCEGAEGSREFCGPSVYAGTVDRLYLNRGAFGDESIGVFHDATVERGLGDLRGKGLGAIARDLNADRRIDLYVANDMEANRLWIQSPDGHFADAADISGVARNFLGEVEASMGVVTGDWNADGLPDLFLSHLTGETNTFYVSDAAGIWQDLTAASRLGPPSLRYTGFGIAACDIELDGDVDFVVANGGVKRSSAASKDGNPIDGYRQPNLLFLRDSDALTFRDRSELGGELTSDMELGRGLVVADLDVDGDCDLILTNCAGPARIYENIAPRSGHWLSLKLVDTRGNREAYGATVRVVMENGSLERDLNPCQGYLTHNEVGVHFGLGMQESVQQIEIRWPDGVCESFAGGPADRCLILTRGGRTTELAPLGSTVADSVAERQP